MLERLWHQVIEDRDIFPDRVVLLPRRGLHLVKTRPDNDLHILSTQSAGGSAAIHGRVPAAQYDDAASHVLDMAKRDIGQPLNADMDICGTFLATRNVKVAALGCT